MPTEFLLASVGAGKTEAAQQRLADVKQRDPLRTKVWCLLATERQIYGFRQRLMEREDRLPVYFNIEFFTFYTLYHYLLESAGRAQRVLDNAGRYRLLRLILSDMEHDGELEYFGAIASTPGFIRVVADFIYELKQGLNTPEAFGNAARTDKDRELARIYALYQDMLARFNLVDREGEGWVASDELANNARLARDVRLLIVDGYDQFNPLQADLLTQLAARANETLITLTAAPGREDTIGKRFQRALERLEDAHRKEPVLYRINRPLATLSSSGRHLALRHLVEYIFSPAAPRIPAGEGLLLIEASEARQEVAAALRRAKALLLAGARPEDILITVRDWARYSGYFDAQAAAYGVPIAIDGDEPLAENPAVYAITLLLNLHRSDFRRRELLDVLQSAYFRIPGIGEAEITLLERLSRKRMVAGGRAAWLKMLDAAVQTAPLPDDEGEVDDSSAATQAALPQLRRALETFFAAVTPPAGKSAAEYAHWLEDLLGDDPTGDLDDMETAQDAPHIYQLSIIGQARKPISRAPGDRMVVRDLAALQAFKRALRSLLSAYRLFARLAVREAGGWEPFYADLLNALKGMQVPRSAGRDGRVLVTGVAEARGLPHAHVIIMGLSEGVFPMRTPEDPLYLDTERLALRARGVRIQTQSERSDDDGLFYEMNSLATQSLTLTRTTLDGGAPQPESHLWRAVKTIFSQINVESVRVGRVLAMDDAASLREVALAIADGLNRGDSAVVRAARWFGTAQGALWSHMQHAHAVEVRRMSRAAYDQHSGRLQEESLIAAAAAALGDRLWSASQLNDYGICGFRYFTRRLLKLEPLKAPEDGMDAAQLGTLYHEILESTYKALAAQHLAIAEDNLPQALAALEQAADALLPDAPARLGFPQPPLWSEEQAVIRQRLERLVRDDFDPDSALNKLVARWGGGARTVHRLETPFGGGRFMLDLGDERLRVTGVIDRIDMIDGRALILDYKTGSTPIPSDEIARGRNYQMMIYLLAAQEMLPEVAGGAFWHIGARKMSGELRADEDGTAIIADGIAHVRAQLARGRAGDFSTEANKIEAGKCSRYCDYSQMCRFAIMGRRKQRGDGER
jgi:ATP-dependent helicase/DNAse subunit B